MPNVTVECKTNMGVFTLYKEYKMDTELTTIKEFVKLCWSEEVVGYDFYFSFNNNIISSDDEEKTLQILEGEFGFDLSGSCKFNLVKII